MPTGDDLRLDHCGPVDCGLGTSTCPGGGQVCLIQRGDITFANKVLNCQAGGGVGAVIYNNAAALFSGTLGGTATSIPSVGTSGTTGAILLGLFGEGATVTVAEGNHAFYDGTSMATPHVSGVAALVWSHDPDWTQQQIRDALAATAEDRGAAGRDNTYGWGVVQAKAALDLLQAGVPPIALSAASYKVRGVNTVDLNWSGATSANVDIYRNSVLLATTTNSAYIDSTGTRGKGSFTYQVCEAGTLTTCSNPAIATF